MALLVRDAQQTLLFMGDIGPYHIWELRETVFFSNFSHAFMYN
jgi:hypothetical protein